MRATYYPPSDRTSQWFARAYPGVVFTTIRGTILHTTESSNWPSYGGGGVAPTFTVKPNYATKKLEWRQHFPVNMSARALRNTAGGVLTNTSNIIQIELVGTSATDGPGMKWYAAPDWALEGLADFFAWLYREWNVPIQSPVTFVSYPFSYGLRASQRMTAGEWNAFKGIAGHQHVPENSHGDPGNIPIRLIMDKARRKLVPVTNTPTVIVPVFPLPAGWYFGPKSGPEQSVSGYYSHRADLMKWQKRMIERGWKLTATGYYDAQTATVAKQFQAEKRLVANGFIRKDTWDAAWTARVT